MVIGAYIHGGFGYNTHTLQDIRRILAGCPEIEEEILISPTVSGYDTVTYSNSEGVTVWLGRRGIGDVERPDNDVWQVSHVTAQTKQALNDFVERLEELEAERAKQIVKSWRDVKWSTDCLESLNNRQIMVVDATLDATLQGRVILKHVQLDSAFEDDGHVIEWVDRKLHHEGLPEAECIEYIAEEVGPYEFVSLEAALMTRDMWRVLSHDSSMIDCMVAGLIERGHVRRLRDWTGWGGTYPFSFASQAGGDRL